MTGFQLAHRYIGEVLERPDEAHHPLIQWWHSRCGLGFDTPDEVPWCSSFVNGIAWELRLPRSKSAAARSWLAIGAAVEIEDARPGWDVVILKRGTGSQPGPDVTRGAAGHVGWFAGVEQDVVLVLGGNHGNAVSIARFQTAQILGIRRLQ